MIKDITILLVGCGKMGSALLSGWIKAGADRDSVVVVEASAGHAKDIHKQYGVEVFGEAHHVEETLHPDIIVFGIKPQVMDEVLPDYKEFSDKGEVFLSIAAGKSISYLESQLGEKAAIVRAMPNLPATVGKGITVMVANSNVSEVQRMQCQVAMEAAGEVIWIDDEQLMDAVTAVSGSGPAYVFYFIESMVKAGIEAGLPAEVATKLVKATLSGSSALAVDSRDNAETLRNNVTSPGGTTEAGLEKLMQDGKFEEIISQTVEAAAERSKKLNK